jgi:rSAM/selenodomain-associated transferase 2
VEISVVIPTLDEAACVAEAVGSVIGPGIEVIVVDGGSRDGTPRLAREAGARVLAGERGRARQLRLGGERSSADAVLFLHADTRLEQDWAERVRSVLADPACAGGAFAFRLAQTGLWARTMEWAVALRVALLGLPYGDQAIFLRRSVLEQMGGVPIVPIMEDLDLVAGIKRAGRLACLDSAATTSDRRYAARGRLRVALQHAVALAAWYLGCDRRRLAEWMGR